MNSPLRILYLEDDPRDAELIQETLEGDAIVCEVARVETEAEFVASLKRGGVDLILADYTLPSFDGISALKIVRQDWPHVPFIFVSGTLGEEVAIEALKNGATDYVFKTRLSRIVPSVQRALLQAKEKVELRRAEEALRRSETYLAEAQKISHTGSFGLNLSTGEIYWSRETYRIFDLDPAAKVTFEMVMQRTHPEDRQIVQESMDRVSREMSAFDFEHRLLLSEGMVKYIRVVGHPAKSESGHFEIVGAVTDITDRKLSEQRLRRSEADLLEAQRVSHTGSYKHHIASGLITSSPEAYRIWDIRPEEDTTNPEFWFSRIHPEDRVRFRDLYMKCLREKTAYETDFRIVLPDGTIRHEHSAGRPVLNNAGEIVEYVATTVDVTPAKLAEETIRQDERELREIVNTIAQLVIFLGTDGQVIYANRFTLEYTGLSLEEMQGEGSRDRVFHPDDVERLREERHRALFARHPV